MEAIFTSLPVQTTSCEHPCSDVTGLWWENFKRTLSESRCPSPAKYALNFLKDVTQLFSKIHFSLCFHQQSLSMSFSHFSLTLDKINASFTGGEVALCGFVWPFKNMGVLEHVFICSSFCVLCTLFLVGLFLLNGKSSLYMRSFGSLSLCHSLLLPHYLLSCSFHSWLLFARENLTFTM